MTDTLVPSEGVCRPLGRSKARALSITSGLSSLVPNTVRCLGSLRIGNPGSPSPQELRVWDRTHVCPQLSLRLERMPVSALR